MRLPGFTAENALSWTCTSYVLGSTHVSAEIGGTVLPQFFFCHGNYCCDEWGNCFYKGPVLQ